MNVIKINSISKKFITGLKRKRIQAVSDISLSIDTGCVFGIIGRNGAGKSTMLKMILGFIKPDDGDIRILNQSPMERVAREPIGYLPENPYFYDHLTVAELLSFSVASSGLNKKTGKKNIDYLLKRVGLFEAKDQRLRTYSKGMTQRAGLCFALVHDPQIVILDEPMSGLDPIGRRMVVDLIVDLKLKGKTILFSSHILNDVERICDKVAVMDKGKLLKILYKEQLDSGIEEKFFETIGIEND